MQAAWPTTASAPAAEENAVTSKQIKNGVVTTNKLKKGAVTTKQLKTARSRAR